ncbi:MAG: cobalt ECF transporter T component CbiQ [Acidimicrobiales bacterium]
MSGTPPVGRRDLHGHLHVPGTSPVHRLAPAAKLVGLLVFVVTVAITPRRAVAAFAVDAAIVAAVVVVARLPVMVIARRLVVVVPFLGAAVLVPFVAEGNDVVVAGVTVSSEGLWATWNITAKALLGASASIVMAATTPLPDVLQGLTQLRVPAVLVAIAAFMFRYLDVISDQLQRMRTAMVARGHDPRWLWQVRPIASSAGTLFVRSYERGERVHQAMAARGFTGTMPELHPSPTGRVDWLRATSPGVVALGALITVTMVS